MSLDLGEFADLAVVLGLVDDAGFVGDWFTRPSDHLAGVLSDDARRAALFRLAGTVLDLAEDTSAGPARRLPLIEIDADGSGGIFSAAVVIDDSGADAVVVGAGVRLRLTTATGVGIDADVHVPIYAVRRGTASVPEPVLLGSAAGVIGLDLTVRLPAAAAPGQVGLGSMRLGASIPTGPGAGPSFRLALAGLVLPGAPAPRDVIVDMAGLDELDDAVLELVLGLVRAQVDGLPADDPLRGLAALLGLTDDAVPDFPIAQLLAAGPTALADWLAVALGNPASRTAWLAALAVLLGGTVAAETVTVEFGPARLELRVAVEPGVAGRPRVTPTVTLSVTGGDGIRLALDADPVAIDLGTGAAVALPRMAVTARLAPAAGSLLGPVVEPASGLTVEVAAFQAGLALDTARRPVLVLQAHTAKVGATSFDVLDLSSAQALAGAVEQVVTDAAAALLAGLGPVGSTVAVLLGLADPPGAGAAVPGIDVATLLADPVRAVAARWAAVFATVPERVPDLLAVLRDALAAADVAADPVTGPGRRPTRGASRWRPAWACWSGTRPGIVTVSMQVDVALADLTGSGLAVALGADVDLVELDLGARRASFLPAAGGRLVFTGPAGAPLSLGTGAVGVGVDALGVQLGWSATGGLRVAPLARAPRLRLPGGEVELPELVVDGTGGVGPGRCGLGGGRAAGGGAAPAAAEGAGLDWLVALVRLLGWLDETPTTRTHVPLAELVADPAVAAAGVGGARSRRCRRSRAAGPARHPARRAGRWPVRVGSPSCPGWSRSVRTRPARAAVPALLTALVPGGGPGTEPTAITGPLRSWQPGDAGTAHRDAGRRHGPGRRPGPRAGGSPRRPGRRRRRARRGRRPLVGDRRAGHLPPRRAGRRRGAPDWPTSRNASPLAQLPLAELLGRRAADRRVRRRRGGRARPAVLPDMPADRVSTCTGAGRPPESFGVPTPGAGDWTVRLGTRGDCRDAASRAATRRRRRAGGAAAPALAALATAAGCRRRRARRRRARRCPGRGGARRDHRGGHRRHAVVAGVGGRARPPPAADALRLLGAMLPDPDPAEPDDKDLGLASALIGTLLALDPLDDPLAQLRPPAAIVVPAGVSVHVVLGRCRWRRCRGR